MKTFMLWLSESFQVFPIDPEEDWEQAGEVEQIARRVGIRPSSNKDVRIVAVNEKGEVIGGIFSSITPDDDMTQQAGQPYSEYQFDVVVHPGYQRQGVGRALIQAAEKERRAYETGYDTKAYTSLQVVNPHLHRYLTQQGGYEVDYEQPEGNKGNFTSRLRKWMKK